MIKLQQQKKPPEWLSEAKIQCSSIWGNGCLRPPADLKRKTEQVVYCGKASVLKRAWIYVTLWVSILLCLFNLANERETKLAVPLGLNEAHILCLSQYCHKKIDFPVIHIWEKSRESWVKRVVHRPTCFYWFRGTIFKKRWWIWGLQWGWET